MATRFVTWMWGGGKLDMDVGSGELEGWWEGDTVTGIGDGDSDVVDGRRLLLLPARE